MDQDQEKWLRVREAMLLDPAVANLNTGSFGPLPRVVFERATELRRRLAEEPMDFLLRTMPELLWEARERLGQFVGANPARLVFVANVSVAVNMVAGGLTLNQPGEILISDHEYGAMHWCWERAAQVQGLTLRMVKLPILAQDPAEVAAAFVHEFNERTRLVFFSHILSPTGMVLPARDICAAARKRGIISVVDGAHAPAMLPLQLDELGCDFYGANCHKWLLAPTGSGFLYLGQGGEDRLQAMQVSWGWKRKFHKLDKQDPFGSTSRIRFYEFEGTRDLCPWMAVPAAIDFQEELGWDAIRRHNEDLVVYVRDQFGRLEGLSLATPTHPDLHGFMTAFRLPPNVFGPALRAHLWEKHRVEAPVVDRPEGLLLRVSTHFFNTRDEVDRLARAMAEFFK